MPNNNTLHESVQAQRCVQSPLFYVLFGRLPLASLAWASYSDMSTTLLSA
jgi:hypothetical protein